jgi:hypothetical protein
MECRIHGKPPTQAKIYNWKVLIIDKGFYPLPQRYLALLFPTLSKCQNQAKFCNKQVISEKKNQHIGNQIILLYFPASYGYIYSTYTRGLS